MQAINTSVEAYQRQSESSRAKAPDDNDDEEMQDADERVGGG
jgi:hypothetical protein